MTTQPIPQVDHNASRERFAANLAKADAPRSPAAPVQSQPNAALEAKARAMAAEIDPSTGKRKHSATDVHNAFAAAYSTPVSAGSVGSSDPRVHPATGHVARDGHHFQRVTTAAGAKVIAEVPDGHVYQVVQTPAGPRAQFVPDASAYRGPEVKTAEPDAFAQQSAERVAQLGDRAGQNAKLDSFLAAVNPATGKKYADEQPAFRANIERARAELFDGKDQAATIAATEARLTESKYAPQVQVAGYTVTAPEGFELDAGEIRKYAAIAKANGVSQEAFQAMVETYVRENAQ